MQVSIYFVKDCGFLGLRVRISYVSFFLNFFTVNNNIPYFLAASKKNYFSFEIFVRKPLEN